MSDEHSSSHRSTGLDSDAKSLPGEKDCPKFSEEAIEVHLYADINGSEVLSGDSQERGEAFVSGGRAHAD